jgi:hypothetical protein
MVNTKVATAGIPSGNCQLLTPHFILSPSPIKVTLE